MTDTPRIVDPNDRRTTIEYLGQPTAKKVCTLTFTHFAGLQIEGDDPRELEATIEEFENSDKPCLELKDPKFGLPIIVRRAAVEQIMIIGVDWIDLEMVRKAISQQFQGRIPIITALPDALKQ